MSWPTWSRYQTNPGAIKLSTKEAYQGDKSLYIDPNNYTQNDVVINDQTVNDSPYEVRLNTWVWFDNSAQNPVGMVFWYEDPDNFHYLSLLDPSNDDNIGISEVDSGTETELDRTNEDPNLDQSEFINLRFTVWEASNHVNGRIEVYEPNNSTWRVIHPDYGDFTVAIPSDTSGGGVGLIAQSADGTTPANNNLYIDNTRILTPP